MGRDLEDTVGVELERDLDLGNTTGGRGDTGKLELAEDVVVLGKRSLTLEDLDQDYGLVISSGGEDLALAGRDSGVAGNQLGHDSTGGLDTEGKRVDIHEDDATSTFLTGEDTSLNSGTESNSLIRVDTLRSLLVEEVLNKLLNLGDTGRTTDEDDVVNLGLLELSVLEDLLNGLHGLLEEINVELLELSLGESLGEVLAVVEGLDLNTGALLRRQSTLGLLGLTLELTHGLEVLGNVDVVLLVVLLGEVVDDSLIEILTTEMGVTSGSQDLEDTVINGEQRDIEGTTTEIVDDDLALTIGLVKTVGNSGGGGLVDDSEDVKTGNDTGVLGGLSLVVLWRVSWLVISE